MERLGGRGMQEWRIKRRRNRRELGIRRLDKKERWNKEKEKDREVRIRRRDGVERYLDKGEGVGQGGMDKVTG